MLQNNNIFVGAFFVLGLPGEKREERLMNRNFILDVGIDWAFFNYATPLRGSELFNMVVKNKWIEDKYLELGAIDMTDYVIRAPGMVSEDIKIDAARMNLDVNFVNNHRFRIGDFKTAKASFEEVISRHEGQPFAHYFLAKTLEKLNPNDQKITFHMDRFSQIIRNDSEWFSQAKYFSLLNESNLQPS